MNAGLGEVKLSGSVTLKQIAGPNATLEDRIRVLESNLDVIDLRSIKLQEQVEQENQNRKEALVAERNTRTQEIDIVRTRLEATETGGLNISLMGLIWLAAGLIMSTASLELSRLF